MATCTERKKHSPALAAGIGGSVDPQPCAVVYWGTSRKGVSMSSGGAGEGIDYAIARGRDWPSVRQLNVFLENRLGALLELVRHFESTDLRIVSISVVDSADCAIIRMVLSDPERALEIFQRAKIPVTESDLLVVRLPEGPQPLLTILKALLVAEINVH